MSIIKHLDAKHIKFNFNINQDNNKFLLVKKKRKKTYLSPEERCKAVINTGKQCSRRKKYNDFCGKHKNKQQFGIFNVNDTKNNVKIKTDLENDTNYLKVKKFKYLDKEYFIDNNNIIFNKAGTLIVGKLDNNNKICII